MNEKYYIIIDEDGMIYDAVDNAFISKEEAIRIPLEDFCFFNTEELYTYIKDNKNAEVFKDKNLEVISFDITTSSEGKEITEKFNNILHN